MLLLKSQEKNIILITIATDILGSIIIFHYYGLYIHKQNSKKYIFIIKNF